MNVRGVGEFEVGTRIMVLHPSRMRRKPGKVTIILDSWWPATVIVVTDEGVHAEFDRTAGPPTLKNASPFFLDWGAFRPGRSGAMARISTIVDRLAELA